jgi:hypothetical protein
MTLDAGTYRVAERTLSIATDSEEVADYVRAAYRPARETGPVTEPTLDRGEIAARENPQAVRFNGAPLRLREHEVGEPFRIGFYGSSRLFRESLRSDASRTAFHAAAVVVGESAALLVGPPNSGKTILTIALLDRGARLLSDEFVLVRRNDGLLRGLARTLHVRETSLPAIQNAAIHACCTTSPNRITPEGARVWDTIDPRGIYGDGIFASTAVLGAVFLLEAGIHDARSELGGVTRSQAAIALARRIAFSDAVAPKEQGAERMRRVAECAAACAGVPCYRLRLGTLASAADLVVAATAPAKRGVAALGFPA